MNSRDDGSNNDIHRSQGPIAAGSERSIRVLDNRLDSRELFAATREIMIDHGGDVYRLRLTAQNKLILTK